MITALLVATRDLLRSELKFTHEECRIQDDGMPSPLCGDRFIAIHGTSWSPDIIDQNQGIDERADITVTITYRRLAIEFDTRGEDIYVRQSLDLENVANLIKRQVHQNYTLITNANALLTGTDKIIEPLRWLGGDSQPQRVDNLWFSSEDPQDFAGLRFTIRFGRARRMQSLARMR